MFTRTRSLHRPGREVTDPGHLRVRPELDVGLQQSLFSYLEAL